MAKKSVINRNMNRRKIADRLRPKREQLREAISNVNLSDDELER